jgi:hypothetical protein
MGEGRNEYRVLVGKPEEKDHFEDQGLDGIKMDLMETGWEGFGVYSPVASCCEHCDEPSGSGTTELV